MSELVSGMNIIGDQARRPFFIPARALLLRVLDDSTIRRKKFGSTGFPLEARPGGHFYFSGPRVSV